MRNFDEIDRRILGILQRDGRITMTDLAPQVGLSVTPCTERVRRMERDGVIAGYHARLNPRALGLNALLFLELRLTSRSAEALTQMSETLAEIPDIMECHYVSGDFDCLVKARLPNLGEYRPFIADLVERLPVVESRSYVVMEEIKESPLLNA